MKEQFRERDACTLLRPDSAVKQTGTHESDN
jgi:hypothetical protein